MFVSLIPIIAIIYTVYFRLKNKKNHILSVLMFMSYMIFATNYTDYGTDIHFFRYLHKGIGVLLGLGVIYYIFKNGLEVLNNTVVFFLISFLIILLISFIGNDVNHHFRHYLINFIFLSSTVLFLYFYIDSKEKLKEVFEFIIGISLILSLSALFEFFILGEYRPFLMYSNPNYLAFSLFLGFTLSLFFNTNYKLIKVSIITLAIVLTGSRSIELAIVILFGIFIFKNYSKIDKKLFFGVLLIVAIIISLFSEKLFYNRDTNTVRIQLAYLGHQAFLDSPVNGIGYGQYRTKFKNYVDESINHPEILEKISLNEEIMTHNDLVKIYAELGILGLLFLVVLFYKMIIAIQKLDKDMKSVVTGLITGVLVFSLFHNNFTNFVFWFVIFLPFIILKTEKN